MGCIKGGWGEYVGFVYLENFNRLGSDENFGMGPKTERGSNFILQNLA